MTVSGQREGKVRYLNLRFFVKLFILMDILLASELLLLYYMFPPDDGAAPPPAAAGREAARGSHPDKVSDREALRARLDLVMGDTADSFCIYLLRPGKENLPFLHNGTRQVRPASMIKIFIMAKAMQDVKDGRHSLDEVIVLREDDMVGGAGILSGMDEGLRLTFGKLVELMITESDNTATNILIDRLGMDNINRYLQEKGYRHTLLRHKMMISATDGGANLSSAEDMGRLFANIYFHQCVDEQRDELMTKYLLGQSDKECFPSALPFWQIAHKTGEIEHVYHDGGIFYGEKEDFILVILNDNYEGRSETIEKMKLMARVIAEYFV